MSFEQLTFVPGQTRPTHVWGKGYVIEDGDVVGDWLDPTTNGDMLIAQVFSEELAEHLNSD